MRRCQLRKSVGRVGLRTCSAQSASVDRRLRGSGLNGASRQQLNEITSHAVCVHVTAVHLC